MTTIPEGHMALLRSGIEEMLRMSGGSIIDMHEWQEEAKPTVRPSRNAFTSKLIRGRMGRHVSPVIVLVRGWGQAFQTAEIRMDTGIDPAKDVGEAVTEALTHLSDRFAKQTQTRWAASRLGIDRPLTGARLESIDHLKVDADAITVLRHMGIDARSWVEHEMRSHRAVTERIGPAEMVASLNGDLFSIPFRLSPLLVTRDARDDTRDLAPYWEDTLVYLEGIVPDTVLSSLVGRPLEDLISDTPIGHRIIAAAQPVTEGEAGAHHLHIELEPRLIPLREALEA